MKGILLALALSLACAASAATTANDDSCDIGIAPAATLLLPYFEVDLDNSNGETTIFTITNVTNLDRIARVTLWTDWAVPILTFNLELRGYGVQSISLYDVLARGVIGPETHVARGRYSKANPASTCDELPRTLPPESLPYLQNAFTESIVPGCNNAGNEHDNAVGYATIDLVTNCSTNGPFAEQYWSEDIAFDNVLIGDYQQVHSANDFAQGAPMVHIRAIPEGGTPLERMAYHYEHGSHFKRTFYGHYQPIYPTLRNGAVGGWVYLNLDNSELDAGASSNWVIASLRAEGRYSVDIDAAPLGNGCSAPAAESEVTQGTAIIGPRPNANP